jgi:hypothetical protein
VFISLLAQKWRNLCVVGDDDHHRDRKHGLRRSALELPLPARVIATVAAARHPAYPNQRDILPSHREPVAPQGPKAPRRRLQQGSGPSPTPTIPWVCFSPGAGQWRAPYGAGILGPRPQAYTTTTSPLYQLVSSSSTSSAWDNAGLITALNNLYQQGGWVMDCCASSQLTNNEGNIRFSTPLSRPHCVTIGNGTTFPSRPRVTRPFALLLVMFLNSTMSF